jgi:dihydrofolate synthase/folylpolyglutamate synthase
MITSFTQAISYLRRAVPNSKNRFPGNLGLTRQAEILRLLGDPQNKIKIIHIAGTSGKGSTAFYLSSLLASHGFQVGLTLSPHLLDIRERFQINNQFISKKEFVFYLNQIIPVIEKIKTTNLGKPTFFEILIALAFYIFYQKKVDYSVVETGLGGLMDGTNTITAANQIAVFTKFGLDHTQVLGSNITSIATQKSGIIHDSNTVFSINQIPSAKLVLNQAAQKHHTTVTYIHPQVNFKNITPKKLFLTYDFHFQDLIIPQLKINTIGLYQVENSALALSVFKFISLRDCFDLNISAIRSTFSQLKFYGRVDIRQIKNQLLILDGAHNPQKMTALIKSLKFFFPDQKFTFVLAFKQRRDFAKMIKLIIPLAENIIITSFTVTSQDMVQLSQSHLSLIKVFHLLNFSKFETISDQSMALQTALQTALQSQNNVVVTGSLYLLGEIYPILSQNSL